MGRLLHRLGYRLQSVRKRQEGTVHPDRNEQFEHINATADRFLATGQAVISVDTKKELVGNFSNAGREWQPKATPPAVRVHDFPSDAEGKAIPYGVYDMARNNEIAVPKDHDPHGDPPHQSGEQRRRTCFAINHRRSQIRDRLSVPCRRAGRRLSVSLPPWTSGEVHPLAPGWGAKG